MNAPAWHKQTPIQELEIRRHDYDQAVRRSHQAEHVGDQNAAKAHRRHARELQESIRQLRAVIRSELKVIA